MRNKEKNSPGGSGEQLTEVDASNNWKHTNFWANGKQIGTYDSSGLHFYFDDPLGTRRVQANASGVLEAVYQSLPYGDDLVSSGTAEDPTENHFTGKERDTESGNDYMFARYYNSATGRFLSPDWSAKEDPVPNSKLENPQTLNLYAYVGNDPIGRVDPDGHESVSDQAEATIGEAEREAEDIRNTKPGFGGCLNCGGQNGTSAPAASGDEGTILNAMDNPTVENALEKVSTFSNGAADWLTLGATKWVNKKDGGSAFIDYKSKTYKAGEATGIGIGVADIAASGMTAAAVRGGKYGATFGRGGRAAGGLLNRGFVRFGWGWEGSATAGRDVIRIGIGDAKSLIHIHIPVWYP